VLVARALGLDVWWQTMAGCIVIVGHNWSMFLGFSGGRGFGVSIGVMLLVAPKELGAMGGISLLGLLAGASAPAMGLGMAASPLASYLFGDPAAVTAGCGIIAFLMFAKRLTSDPGSRGVGPAMEQRDPEPYYLRPRYQRRARLAGTAAAPAGYRRRGVGAAAAPDPSTLCTQGACQPFFICPDSVLGGPTLPVSDGMSRLSWEAKTDTIL